MLVAIAKLQQQGVPVKLTLVGTGSDAQWLKDYALPLGIDEQVLFTGAVDQDHILEFYHAADFEPNAGKRVWGVARDLAAAPRLRPSGLVMKALNQLLPADVHLVKRLDNDDETPHFTVHRVGALLPFQHTPSRKKLRYRCQKPTWQLWRLDSASPTVNNEVAELLKSH